MDPLILLVGAGSLAGLTSHLGYFIRGEHQIKSPIIAGAGMLATSTATFTLVYYAGWSLTRSTGVVGLVTVSFLVTLFASMLFYRLVLHPLKQFPGPFIAKVTKLWFPFQITTGFHNFRVLHKLHQQYGDFVRTGPNEISIADPRAVEIIHGPKSTCFKSEWYDLALPLTTLHQMRNRPMHDRRRKVWDKAFNIKSLRGYESRVLGYADKLVEQLSQRAGESLDVSKWFIYYTFDVMGEMAFGRSFNALSSGESHYVMKIMHNSSKAVGIIGCVPWVLRFLTKIPKQINPIQIFLDYSDSCVEARKEMTLKEPDVMHYLLDGEPFFQDPEKEKLLLAGDARLIIVAGSDTTATTLAFAFFEMCKEPSQMQKIRDELKQATGKEDFDVHALSNLLHLNGVINETLRLHPAVPGGVYRNTGPEGITIGDTYIPGEVTVLTPTYTIQRSPLAFSQPDSFIPERWYSQPELILDKTAFFPFLTGPFGCVGKQLAYMELRTVIARLLLEFDVRFADGEDGTTLRDKSEDCFTVALAELKLVFEKRK